MKHTRSLVALAVIGSLLVGSTCTCVLAQGFPLETYALPHLFSLPTATTTRLFGMGGFVTCIKDAGFGNPAFAATLDKAQAVGRTSWTNCAVDLTGTQFSVAFPVNDASQGIQITHFDLDSSPGTIVMNRIPIKVSVDEKDLALHYGRRFGEKWAVGVGMSPIFESSTDLYHPLTGDQLGHIESDSDFGFRLGALYEIEEGCLAGFIYDRYDEDVTGAGLAFGAPQTGQFRSEEIALGVSKQFDDCIIGAIEWQQLTTEGGSSKIGDSGMRAGIEAAVGESWALRVGSNDGSLSLGAGYSCRKLSVQYAYINDWNADAAKAALGNSDTHQLEATYIW